MIHKNEGYGPRRLRKPVSNYVPNEVVISTVAAARNDGLPHYLSVASGSAKAVTTYGDASIDGIVKGLGLAVRSMARIYVPRADVLPTAGLASLSALVARGVSAAYEEDEDAGFLSRTYRITFCEPINVPKVCDELKQSSAVQYATPNYISEVRRVPNDTFYHRQWGLAAINAEAGWELETGHPDVLIAIVDSGVDLQHDDLSSKLAPGYDFVDYQGTGNHRYDLLGDYQTRDDNPDDEDGHGTHCAGIAAALGDNGQGVAGVCWGGRVLPVRVMFRVYDNSYQQEMSVGTDVDIDAGIKYAVDSGAHVINLSLGGDEPSHDNVLRYAHDREVVVLAATGNENSRAPSYPASNPTVLAVGAVDEGLRRARFSNYGPKYNRFVVAPGVDIASSYKDNAYEYLSGTSMATPFVTGLAGLIVSMVRRNDRQLSADDVYEIIRETARPLGPAKGDTFLGEGIVDVKAALEATKERIGGLGERVGKVVEAGTRRRRGVGQRRRPTRDV